MKKIYLIFIPIFISFSFILPKAYTNEQIYNAIFSNKILTKTEANSIVDKISTIDNKWATHYYIIHLSTYQFPQESNLYWITFIDKLTGEIIVYSIDQNQNSAQLQNSNMISYVLYNNSYNLEGTYNSYNGSQRLINTNIVINNVNGDQGTIIYTNVPIKYKDNSNNWIYLVGRQIPYEYFPSGHPLSIPPVDVLPGDQVDSIVDTNLTTILDSFDIDLLFKKLESVLEQIYGFIESAFLSLNEVITYITSSLNNVVSFITANITIISIISMVYLALPSILRDLFTLALSTSVVFIMLRRFI